MAIERITAASEEMLLIDEIVWGQGCVAKNKVFFQG
jgi:hypothetical protein